MLPKVFPKFSQNLRKVLRTRRQNRLLYLTQVFGTDIEGDHCLLKFFFDQIVKFSLQRTTGMRADKDL
jgi:hypothetical protein